jgi:hypothetical protein
LLALKEEKISLVQTGSHAIVNFYYLKRNRDKSMCLAVPSKIIEIKDNVAKVDVDGVIRETSGVVQDVGCRLFLFVSNFKKQNL